LPTSCISKNRRCLNPIATYQKLLDSVKLRDLQEEGSGGSEMDVDGPMGYYNALRSTISYRDNPNHSEKWPAN